MEAQNVKTEKSSDKPVFERVPLSEWGPQLPVGIAVGPEHVERDLIPRVWNLRVEKEISRLRSRHKTANFAKFASIVMCHVYEQIGSIKPDKGAGLDKKTQSVWARKLAEVGNLYMPDALYAFVYLRYHCLGPNVSLELQCKGCGNVEPFTGDLATLEVSVVDDIEKTKFEYQLRDPFDVRGNKCTGFKLGIPKWNAIESAKIEGQLDAAGVKAALLQGSIISCLGEGLDKTAISPVELEEMSKFDFETVLDQINNRQPGPNMAVEMPCSKCGLVNDQSLDWMYDSFFGVSGPTGSS